MHMTCCRLELIGVCQQPRIEGEGKVKDAGGASILKVNDSCRRQEAAGIVLLIPGSWWRLCPKEAA